MKIDAKHLTYIIQLSRRKTQVQKVFQSILISNSRNFETECMNFAYELLNLEFSQILGIKVSIFVEL